VTWILPSSPDAKAYSNVYAEIEFTEDPKQRLAKFAALAEDDFYVFVRHSAFGKYRIRDEGHKNYGGFWVDEPFVFETCRMFQEDVEKRNTNVWYNLPRFYFKTEILTKLGSVWETVRDPSLTTAFIIYKIEQVGEQFFQGLMREILTNPVWIAHWPHVFARDKNEYERFTNDAVILKRPTGPKEPTFSLHSITAYPTSGHYRRIRFDDVVTQENFENGKQIKAVVEAIQGCIAIQAEDTLTTFCGTVWGQHDAHMQLDAKGYFSRRVKVSAYDGDGNPVLRSRKFIEAWRVGMSKLGGPHFFAAQMMNEIIPRGEQCFLWEWLKRYDNRPLAERKGKFVHLFIDISTGTEEGDFGVFRVIGLGEDRKKYNLELIRERFQWTDFLDALFSTVRRWTPDATWVEEAGHMSLKQALTAQMELEKYRFTLSKIPLTASRRLKSRRIEHSQAAHARGEHYYPAEGFGHGSKADQRDTMAQLWDDEMRYWTPLKGATLTDDMLDCGAWVDQPEMQSLLRYPKSSVVNPQDEIMEDLRELYEKNRVGGGRREAGPAGPWAF
jgi:hypothetical protein